MAGKIQLHFLPTVTAQKRTQRDVELSQSSARSHVARLSHRRRDRTAEVKLSSTWALTGPSKQQKEGIVDNSAGDSSQSASGKSHWEISLLKTSHTPCDRQPLGRQSNYSKKAYVPSLSSYTPNRWLTASDELANPQTYELLHYCATIFWPAFDPGAGGSHTAWEFLVLQGPAVFHAMMWKSALCLSFHRQVPVTDYTSLRHYQKALGYLSKSIAEPIESIAEPIIYAILSLSLSETYRNMDKSERIFNAPFADLRYLNLYSRQPVAQSHTRALYRIVAAKGGINGLNMEGFAADVLYMDTIISTQYLSNPGLAIPRVLEHVLADNTRQNCFGYYRKIGIHGESYANLTAQIKHLHRFGLRNDIFEVMQDLRVWMKVVEHLDLINLNARDLPVLAIKRNLLQHKLLETITPEETIHTRVTLAADEHTTDVQSLGLDRLVQTGLLISAIGITFPVADDQPYKLLALRLAHQLNRNLQQLVNSQMQDLIVWLSILGCLAAKQVHDIGLKDKFINMIHRVEGHTGRSWTEVKRTVLSPFLWHEAACEVHAKDIWEEVSLRRAAN